MIWEVKNDNSNVIVILQCLIKNIDSMTKLARALLLLG